MISSTEVWKDIPGYEGRYQVSDMGRVKSLARVVSCGTWNKSQKERVLKPGLCKGYKQVVLCKDGKREPRTVHRLVAQAFLENSDGKPQINHKDGDKENNRASNLEWATCSENNLHRRRVLNGGGGKPARAVINLDTGRLYPSVTAAAKATGQDLMGVLQVCKGRRNTAGGYRWAYAEEVEACEP